MDNAWVTATWRYFHFLLHHCLKWKTNELGSRQKNGWNFVENLILKYLYICNGVVIHKIVIVVAVGWRLTHLLLHGVGVKGLSWHGVVVIVGDILDWLKGRSNRLGWPGVEAGLIVLSWRIVGGGGVHIGQGGGAGVVTVILLTMTIPRHNMVSKAISIVMYGSPSELLSLTQFPSLCDALESLIIMSKVCINLTITALPSWMDADYLSSCSYPPGPVAQCLIFSTSFLSFYPLSEIIEIRQLLHFIIPSSLIVICKLNWHFCTLKEYTCSVQNKILH